MSSNLIELLARGLNFNYSGDAQVPALMAAGMLETKVSAEIEKYIGTEQYWKLGLTAMNITQAREAWDHGGLDGVGEWHPAFVQSVASKFVAKAKQKKARIRAFGEQSLDRRAKYLPAPTLRFRKTEKGDKYHWRFDPMLEPAGLLQEYLNTRDMLPAGVPVVIRLLNELAEVVGGSMTYPEIPASEWKLLREHGFLPTKGNLAFCWDGNVSKVMKEWSGDNAIVLNGYAQRLGAALIPEGYKPRIRVGFSKCRLTEDGTPLFVWDEGFETAQPDGADGSHFYNADALPQGDDKSIQFSLLGDEIVAFGKGIADPLPSERCNGFDLVMDPDQIKGGYKGYFHDGDEWIADIGILRTFNGGEYPLGFEQIQFMDANKHPMGKEQFVKDLVELMNEFVGDMLKKGVWGLLSTLANDSPAIATAQQLLSAIDPEGKVNPLAIDVLADALDEALKSQLWQLAQGGGIRGAQLEIKMDSRLNMGECVAFGFKPGQEVAVWRFPTVLPQGLRTLHCVKKGGRVLPVGRIYMNPIDVLAMQGDDDGDVVGCSDDTRVIDMFKSRMTDKMYAVEPKGEKMNMPIESEEGLAYLETDPRGPVGITTIWQASIMACKGPKVLPYAIAMAVLNQYAIDSAKKAVIWPDLLAMAEPSAWKLNRSTGFYEVQCKPLLPDQHGVTVFPLKDTKPCYVMQWGKMRKVLGIKKMVLNEYDGTEEEVVTEPLAWRIQHGAKGQKLKKKIELSAYEPCRKKDKGFGGGNLVHAIHDKARVIVMTELGLLTKFEKASVRELLVAALEKKGYAWTTKYSSFTEYAGEARKMAAIEWYGERYSRLLKNYSVEDRAFHVDALNMEWEVMLASLDADTLLEVWWWEQTPTWVKYTGSSRHFTSIEEPGLHQANKPKHAWRVLWFKGSPVLEMLDMDGGNTCPFTTDYIIRSQPDVPSIIENVISDVLDEREPWKMLNNKIHSNTAHGKMVRDEDGNPVELWQCHACCRNITGIAMKQFRLSSTLREQKFMKDLTSSMNKVNRDINTAKSGEIDQDWADYIGSMI